MLPGWRSEKTLLFSFMAYRSPGEVPAGLDTRLDTPPISLRHHPFSRIVPDEHRCRWHSAVFFLDHSACCSLSLNTHLATSNAVNTLTVSHWSATASYSAAGLRMGRQSSLVIKA